MTATGPLVVSLVVVDVFALAASKPNFARCGQRVSPSSSFLVVMVGGASIAEKVAVVMSGGID